MNVKKRPERIRVRPARNPIGKRFWHATCRLNEASVLHSSGDTPIDALREMRSLMLDVQGCAPWL